MTRAGVCLTAMLAAATLASAGAAAAASATPAPITAVAMEPGRARPAESGGRDSAATLGPLAIGAAVRDPTGAEIGRVTRLTTAKDGRSIAEIRRGDDVFKIPLDQLYASGGKAFSTATLDELKHSDAAH